MRGLPIGEGEVWQDSTMRLALLVLTAAAFLPLVALFGPAFGLVSVKSYEVTLVLPVLALVVVIGVVAARRHPPLFRRMLAGLWAGVLGVVVYDLLYMLAAAGGYTPSLVPLWTGVGGGESLLGSLFHHWVTFGALWGMAYGLVAGKARWTYGALFGLAMWANVATFALFVPFGGPFVPGATATAMAIMLLGFCLFGAVLGLVNQRLQPEERPRGKIIFLRDYQRVRNRK